MAQYLAGRGSAVKSGIVAQYLAGRGSAVKFKYIGLQFGGDERETFPELQLQRVNNIAYVEIR